MVCIFIFHCVTVQAKNMLSANTSAQYINSKLTSPFINISKPCRDPFRFINLYFHVRILTLNLTLNKMQCANLC